MRAPKPTKCHETVLSTVVVVVHVGACAPDVPPAVVWLPKGKRCGHESLTLDLGSSEGGRHKNGDGCPSPNSSVGIVITYKPWSSPRLIQPRPSKGLDSLDSPLARHER